MPRIQIHKLIRPLDLGNYAVEFEGQNFDVWVNPPREIIGVYVEVQDDLAKLKAKMEEIVERSKQDGVGQDLTADIAKLDEDIDKANERVFKWFAQIWSQGPDESKYETPESIRAFAMEASDTDPALWNWISGNTLVMINEHREGNRKN